MLDPDDVESVPTQGYLVINSIGHDNQSIDEVVRSTNIMMTKFGYVPLGGMVALSNPSRLIQAMARHEIGLMGLGLNKSPQSDSGQESDGSARNQRKQRASHGLRTEDRDG